VSHWPLLSRRALRIMQNERWPLYLFSLTAREILQIADISQVSSDEDGELISYRRRDVRRHIQAITDHLDGEEVLFPNSIILALPSSVRFVSSRGPRVSDGVAIAGTLEIPIPQRNDPNPGWIVYGRRRVLALARCKREDLPVPVNAFVIDPTPLPPTRPSSSESPSALCDRLNQADDSPFHGMIRHRSVRTGARRSAVVADTSIINMLEESLRSSAGTLFRYRNLTSGETDLGGVWAALILFWTAVRDTFPDAWGKPPNQSRLMHGTGIRAMGRLMDRVMATIDPGSPDAPGRVRAELARIAPYCRWTSGTWEASGMRWNDIQNVPRHLNDLSNFLIRMHIKADTAWAQGQS
jgi:hypothetical protein